MVAPFNLSRSWGWAGRLRKTCSTYSLYEVLSHACCSLIPKRKVDALAYLNEVTKGNRVKRLVKTSHGCQWSGVSSHERSGLILYKHLTLYTSSWELPLG